MTAARTECACRTVESTIYLRAMRLPGFSRGHVRRHVGTAGRADLFNESINVDTLQRRVLSPLYPPRITAIN